MISWKVEGWGIVYTNARQTTCPSVANRAPKKSIKLDFFFIFIVFYRIFLAIFVSQQKFRTIGHSEVSASGLSDFYCNTANFLNQVTNVN